MFGGNGGAGDYWSGDSSIGGGGGAGGNGGSGNGRYDGAGGAGVSTTLAGILSVYNSSYKFCSGGSYGSSGLGYGNGAQRADPNSIPAFPSTSGNQGAVIIAVPA